MLRNLRTLSSFPLYLLALCIVSSAVFSVSIETARAAEDYDDAKKRVKDKLTSRNPDTRLLGVQALAKTGDGKAVKPILDMIRKEWHHDVAEQMGRCFKHFTSIDALDDVDKAVRKLKGEDNAFLAYYAYIGICEGNTEPGNALINYVLTDKKSRDLFIKLALVNAIGAANRPDLAKSICSMTKNSEDTVLYDGPILAITTSRVATKIADDSNKFVLVEAMASLLEHHENESVKIEAAQAAGKIAGKPAYTDYRYWLNWVKTKGGEADAEREHHTDEERAPPTFFGTEAVGKRVVFVIDQSGSMRYPVSIPPQGPPPPEKPKEKEKDENITGKKDKKEDKEEDKKEKKKVVPKPDYSKVKTKMELAKVELIYSLRLLPEDYSFNVIVYSDGHQFALSRMKGLIPATDKNKEAVIAEVKKLSANGYTNIHGAVRHAFMVTEKGELGKEDDPALDEEIFESGAETVFFLTDGVPTHSDVGSGSASRRAKKNAPPKIGSEDPYGNGQGRQMPSQERMNRTRENIIRDFRRMNTFRRVVINTVGIGRHDNELMQGLAESSGGVYRDFSGY